MGKPGCPPAKVRKSAFNLRVDDDVIRRIKLHALLGDRTASDVVAWLVREHLPDVAVVEQRAPRTEDLTSATD